jgi:RNA polymerase sigma-70 factor (ECF subfamily)
MRRPTRSLAHKRFERHIEPWLPDLRRFALRLTGNRADAEDLIGDLIERLYPRLDEIARLDQPKPWLSRVLYRLFVDRWRRQQSGPDYDSDSAPDDTPSADALPEADFERQLTRDRLRAALDRLPAAHRELVLLYDVEGYRLAEISEIMATPVGTLKSRLHRARLRLRELLADGTDHAHDS